MAREPRMESAAARGLRFGFIGLLGGGLAGAGFATPIYLVGGAGEYGYIIRALLIGFPAGGLLGGLIVGFVFQEGIGGLVGRAFAGGHGRTKAEYSHIQAMIMRGAYKDALAACDREADAAPRDPQPLILGAEILREHMKQYESAVQWLKRAREIPRISHQQDVTITRELVELFERKLDTPERALPELARIMEAYPDTRAAEWARTAMEQIKAEVWSGTGTDPDGPDPEPDEGPP